MMQPFNISYCGINTTEPMIRHEHLMDTRVKIYPEVSDERFGIK